MKNEIHKEFFGKSRWPGYPKNHTCACGAVFLANAPKAKWCKECGKQRNREKAANYYLTHRRVRVATLARGLQELLSKKKDEMSMTDHWLKSFYLENVKRMSALKAFAKAKKRVRTIRGKNLKNQNNMLVYFTAQEKKNIKKNSARWNMRAYNPTVLREEQVLREFGY